MDGHTIDEAEIAAYAAQMRRADRAAGTRAKYLRDVRALRAWLAGRGLTQELLNDWRAELAGKPLTRLLEGEVGLTVKNGRIELL